MGRKAEVGYLLVANAGLGHRPTDPRPQGFNLLSPGPLSSPVPPSVPLHSLAELEKEISSLRKGLREVEMVSTSFLMRESEGLQSGALGQTVGPPGSRPCQMHARPSAHGLGERIMSTTSSTEPAFGRMIGLSGA